MTGTARATPHMRDHQFRAVWSAGTVSAVGTGITSVAIPLIAVAVLHVGVQQVAILTALSWLPNLLGPVVGHWVDQRRRVRSVAVAADVARAVLLVSVPVTAALGVLTLVQLYAAVLLVGAGSVLFATADSRIFVLLLAREDFVAAQGSIAAGRALADLVGPALGGVLAQLIGAPAALGVDAASYLVSAALLRSLHLPSPGRADTQAAARAETSARLRDAISVLWTDPVLRAGLGSAATVNLFTFLVAGGLTVLYARQDLSLQPSTIGLALSAGAIGGVLTAALAPRVVHLLGVGRTATLGAMVFPASLLLLAFAHHASGAPLLAAAELVGGVGVMLYDVPLNAVQAAAIPDAVRSSVVGSFSAINYGTRPIGSLLGGVIAGTVGLRATFIIAALGGSLSACWLLISPIRRMR